MIKILPTFWQFIMAIAVLVPVLPTLAEASVLPVYYLQRVDNPSEMVTLDYKNKVTVLVVWKADCKGCDEALREAETAQNALKTKGLKVYGLSTDTWGYYDARGKLQVHTQLPQLHDAGLRVTANFNHLATPTWIAISEGGVLMGQAATAAERQALLQKIRSLLSSKGG